jgi:hypothetical protein
MKKLFFFVLLLALVSCDGDGVDWPGENVYDVKGSYDPVTRCVTIEWDYDEDPAMDGIKRTCSGDCRNIDTLVEPPLWAYSKFENCYDDLGYGLDFHGLDVFGDAPAGAGSYKLTYTLWVRECDYNSTFGGGCYEKVFGTYTTPDLYRVEE